MKRRGVRGWGWGSEGCERVGLDKRGGMKGRGWRVWLEEERGVRGWGWRKRRGVRELVEWGWRKGRGVRCYEAASEHGNKC